MASRKAKSPSPQLGLGLSTSPAVVHQSPPQTPPEAVAHDADRTSTDSIRDAWSPPSAVNAAAMTQAVFPDLVAEGRTMAATLPLGSNDVDLETFDDYDELSTVDGVPRLRLVDPPRDGPSVIVESVGEVFEVSRLRDNGTTVASVMYTRKELIELRDRILAALEMG